MCENGCLLFSSKFPMLPLVSELSSTFAGLSFVNLKLLDTIIKDNGTMTKQPHVSFNRASPRSK